MPHDVNGKRLSVGDLVMLPCRVTALSEQADGCNVTLEASQAAPDGEYRPTVTCNAKLTELADAPAYRLHQAVRIKLTGQPGNVNAVVKGQDSAWKYWVTYADTESRLHEFCFGPNEIESV